jgi:hypothetical protein
LIAKVFLQCRFRVDRDVVQAGRDLALGVEARLLGLECARHVVARGDFRDDRPQPAPRRHQSDRGGDGRLPDPALAGDDEQLLGEQTQSSPSQ